MTAEVKTASGGESKRSCLTCEHFDPDDTELPVCMLHRRYVVDGMVCGDHDDEEG